MWVKFSPKSTTINFIFVFHTSAYSRPGQNTGVTADNCLKACKKGHLYNPRNERCFQLHFNEPLPLSLSVCHLSWVGAHFWAPTLNSSPFRQQLWLQAVTADADQWVRGPATSASPGRVRTESKPEQGQASPRHRKGREKASLRELVGQGSTGTPGGWAEGSGQVETGKVSAERRVESTSSAQARSRATPALPTGQAPTPYRPAEAPALSLQLLRNPAHHGQPQRCHRRHLPCWQVPG
jgi:hypothetical protein